MPIVVSCKIAETGITVMKVHIDNGSSVDIIYEQCFVQLPESIKANLQTTAVSLTGFAGESSLPIGILPLDIELDDVNDDALARQVRLDFYVMRVSSRYNMLLGRTTISRFGIIPSTIHGQETGADADNMEMINTAYPEQKIKVGRNVSADTRKQIVQLLVQYMDVFAWLNVNPVLKPVIQKRMGMAPDRVKWLCDEIPMAQEDADKTAFHTGKGIYSYIMMPFGLINVGATYQRLIDTAFDKQIGRNLEAFVDDLVIKSTTQERIIDDMRETFDTLRRINMKLNPLRCSFGETEGKFLGYLVTEQGIQANPKKITAIENMTAPRTVKEVQSLTGKLVALTRFLSKAAERQLPFFKTLKGCLKQKSFVWSSEVETAF
ncbi:uncharacterized protein [Rutidosis leptorrhynchoides]|uniref:uncharacterized protein n=1 Tax=Rutidosis leptorrhynchoides TaxID=125765 RepID=UPI003A9A297E